jgi:hypothetical protein
MFKVHPKDKGLLQFNVLVSTVWFINNMQQSTHAEFKGTA